MFYGFSLLLFFLFLPNNWIEYHYTFATKYFSSFYLILAVRYIFQRSEKAFNNFKSSKCRMHHRVNCLHEQFCLFAKLIVIVSIIIFSVFFLTVIVLYISWFYGPFKKSLPVNEFIFLKVECNTWNHTIINIDEILYNVISYQMYLKENMQMAKLWMRKYYKSCWGKICTK